MTRNQRAWLAGIITALAWCCGFTAAYIATGNAVWLLILVVPPLGAFLLVAILGAVSDWIEAGG